MRHYLKRNKKQWVLDITPRQDKSSLNVLNVQLLRGRFGEQKMANFPYKRTTKATPFTYCGIAVRTIIYQGKKKSRDMEQCFYA